MSGGYFNYTDSQFQSELFGWTDKPGNVLEDRELSDMTRDLLNLIHTFDYYKSGDCDKEKYLNEKRLFKYMIDIGCFINTLARIMYVLYISMLTMM